MDRETEARILGSMDTFSSYRSPKVGIGVGGGEQGDGGDREHSVNP